MIDANDIVNKITDNQQKVMKSVTNVFLYQIFNEPYSYFLLFLSSKPNLEIIYVALKAK
jgi:hypothetical protein